MDAPENGGASLAVVDVVPAPSSSQNAASSSSSTPAPSVHPLRARLARISSHDHLLLKLPSGIIKPIKPWFTTSHNSQSEGSSTGPQQQHQQRRVPGSTRPPKAKKGKGYIRHTAITSLGKFGSFDLRDLEEVPFGWTWEIGPPKGDSSGPSAEGAGAGVGEDNSMTAEDGKTNGNDGGKGKKKGKQGRNDYVPSEPGSLRLMLNSTLSELESTTATNEDIFDDPTAASRLSMLDVQALKDSGLEGADLIAEMTKSSTSYEKRTVWSQDKFVKRKEAKHLKLFTPLAPTLANLAEYHFEKASDKIRNLRIDALAQMLSFGNVGPGGRFLVVDGTNGLLTTAVLDRMGGQGRVIVIHDNEATTTAPEWEVLTTSSLPKATVIDPVLRILHWAMVEESYEYPSLPAVPEKLDESVKEQGPEGLKRFKARERDRYKAGRKWTARREMEALRQELFDGDFDGLLIASPYDPLSILEPLLPFLSGSASLAIHHPYLQPLISLHSHLRSHPTLSKQVVNLAVTEPWMRRYQVLPGRTHPEMSTSSTGGYVLSGIKVWDEDEAKERREEVEEEEVVEVEVEVKEEESVREFSEKQETQNVKRAREEEGDVHLSGRRGRRPGWRSEQEDQG